MRILVVEDEARLASAVQRYLQENAFAVDVAGNGTDAIFLASVNPYDAIVLDVGIPAPDGFEVLRRLRERGNEARVLVLTARDAVEDRVHGLETGADDYLVKPFSLAELRARIRALLRRGDALVPDVLRVADLELDANGQTARRAGEAVPLTAKEFALLEYLVRNAGRVVGRAEISDKVWDERYDPASNLIEVYINRLRRKVDAGRARPLIRTRRGAGYVLTDAEGGDADAD